MKNRDLRRYTRQTNVQLILGGILITFILGDGLIYIIYGQQAAVGGLLCLASGMLPVLAIVAFLWFLDWVVKRNNRD